MIDVIKIYRVWEESPYKGIMRPRVCLRACRRMGAGARACVGVLFYIYIFFLNKDILYREVKGLQR